MKWWLGVCVFFLCGCVIAAERLVVGDFKANGLNHWETKVFKGNTRYRLVDLDGVSVLQADSQRGASGLFRKIRIDLDRTPYLHWSWRVDRTLGNLNERTKAGDDYPARIYVVVSGGLLFWKTQALNYVWSNNQIAGAEWLNAFTANARMIAQRGKNDTPGVWLHERRDVRSDVRRLLGPGVRYLDAVALMTDTDNSGGEARAYYANIYFSSE